MNKDDELFEEYDDEPTRRWEGAAPRRLEQPRSTNSSFLGYNNGTIRRPPLLETEEKYLTNDDLDALQEDFEDVSSPRKDIKLPGMATTPGGKPTGSHRLVKPTFGAVLSKEEFQPELDTELELAFAGPSKVHKGSTAMWGDDEFQGDTVAEAEDGIVPFSTEETARADVQNAQLAKAEAKLDALKVRAAELQEELKQAQQLNKQLKSEVKKLRTDNLEIEERVEDIKREGEAKGLVKANSKEEEKKFKELEARMKREEAKRKALELGLEHDDEVFEIAGDRFGIAKAIQQNIKKATNFFHSVDGMHTKCKRAESRFGSGIALYFWFFRWMILSTFLLMVAWLSYFITHIITFAIQGRKLAFVGGIFPNFLLYSSFNTDWASGYATMIGLSLIATLAFAVRKFIREFELKHKADVYYLDGEPARYAKIALNAWDWNNADGGATKECGARVKSLMQVLQREDTAAARIAARTQKEWTSLYIKRTVGVSVNFLVIVAGWGGIIFSKLYLGSSVAADYTGVVALLIKNLPVVVPSVVNGALPALIDMAVTFEAWDDPSTSLKMKVARLYAAKILNALIQVAVVLIFVRGPIPLLGGNRVLFRSCGYATCEDQVGVAFFTLYMTDVIIGTVSGALVPLIQAVVFTSIGMKESAYAEFQPPVQIIKVLYQQIFLWLSLPHFPAVFPFAVLLWFIQFRVDVWVLFTYNAKKVTPFDARGSGIFFATFYTLTLFLFAVWMYYVFFQLTSDMLDLECCRLPALILNGNSTVRTCFELQTVPKNGKEVPNYADVCLADALSSSGYDAQPLTAFSSASMSNTLSSAMAANSGSSWLLGIIDSPLLGYFTALCIFLMFAYEQMRVRVLEEYLDETIGEISNSIKTMEEKRKIKQKRIDLINFKDDDDDATAAVDGQPAAAEANDGP